MGSNDGNPDEKPAHPVYLDGFMIDKFEVTNTQYAACFNAGGCKSLTKMVPTREAVTLAIRYSIIIQWFTFRGVTPTRTVHGPASDCRPKPNGRKPRAERTAEYIRGEMNGMRQD